MKNTKELELIKLIDEEYKEWQPKSNILIGAAMGSGKTQFVLNTLSKHAKENKKKILFLSNRTELTKEINSKIEELKLYGIVEVLTYQALERTLLNRNNGISFSISYLNVFNYVICDECHYFLTDAWTNKTDISYFFVLNHPKAVKLYMSATHYNIFTVLKKDFKELKQEFKEYYINPNFDYINKVVYFNNFNTVDQIIEELPQTEKLIYFNRKLNNALELHLKYKENSAFVCSKTNKEFKKYITDAPIENNKLTRQLTFTSTTWDNGINIIDSDVKHVVIDIEDIVLFTQCLGRRRKLKNDNGFILYIKYWSKEELTRFINPKLAQRNLNDNFITKNKEYLNKLKNGEVKQAKSLFIDPETNKLTLNKLYDKNIRCQIAEYRKMTAPNTNYVNYINSVLNVKNVDYINLTKDKREKEIDEFKAYLNNIINKKLFSKEQEELCNLIKKINGIESKFKISGRKLHPSTLQKILNEELLLNYIVSDKKRETIGENRRKYYIIINK